MRLYNRKNFEDINESINNLFKKPLDTSTIGFYSRFEETPFWIKDESRLYFENPFSKIFMEFSDDAVKLMKTHRHYTSEFRKTLNRYNNEANEIQQSNQHDIAELLSELHEDIEKNKEKYFSQLMNESVDDLFKKTDYNYSKVKDYYNRDYFKERNNTIYIDDKDIVFQNPLGNLKVKLSFDTFSRNPIKDSNGKRIVKEKEKELNDQVNAIMFRAQNEIAQAMLDFSEDIEENKDNYYTIEF